MKKFQLPEVVTTFDHKSEGPTTTICVTANRYERLSLKTKQRRLVNIEPLFIKVNLVFIKYVLKF